MTWTDEFWNQLTVDRPAFEATMYYGKQEALGVPVQVVAGSPRVPVSEHVLGLLKRVDAKTLADRLVDQKQKRLWETNTAAVQTSEGKTVSLFAIATAALVPLGSPRRTTLNSNVNMVMYFRLSELREVVAPEVRDRLAKLKAPYATVYKIAGALGIVTPNSVDDPDVSNDADDADHDADDELDADDALDTDDEFDQGGAGIAKVVPATDGQSSATWDEHFNLIFFGPPGTGKSYKLQQIVEKHLGAASDCVYRVTFHPEFSYFDFVGSYKPRVGWMRSVQTFTDADGRVHDSREPRIYYAFDPGPFSLALVAAIKNPAASTVVIIEEINRGNCAAIFGDVFQLLDRHSTAEAGAHGDAAGFSEYPIVPSAEWRAWLDDQLGGLTSLCWRDGRLRIPRNLYLYATMNTSDQSLFPMDTAFRRRWGLQYVGVDSASSVRARVRLSSSDPTGVAWSDFARILNASIVEHTRSDDKQMGPWFIMPAPGSDFVAEVQFTSKVLFYLWSEVFRDAPQKIFDSEVHTYDQLVSRHSIGRPIFSKAILEALQSDAK